MRPARSAPLPCNDGSKRSSMRSSIRIQVARPPPALPATRTVVPKAGRSAVCSASEERESSPGGWVRPLLGERPDICRPNRPPAAAAPDSARARRGHPSRGAVRRDRLLQNLSAAADSDSARLVKSPPYQQRRGERGLPVRGLCVRQLSCAGEPPLRRQIPETTREQPCNNFSPATRFCQARAPCRFLPILSTIIKNFLDDEGKVPSLAERPYCPV